MRIAAIQMCSTPDKMRNLKRARELFEDAVGKGAKVVAFPENFLLFTDDSRQFLGESESIDGPSVSRLKSWAREKNTWILAGSLPLKATGKKPRVGNSSVLVSPRGMVAARYNKIHLFDARLPSGQVYAESRDVRAGRRIIVAKMGKTMVGLSICYDLRFPELYRRLVAKGARVLFVPSAFTFQTGKAHWDVLTRARAIENQAYVVAPAQCGSPFKGKKTYGHARIVNPWGDVMGEKSQGDGVVWVDLDWEAQDQLRKRMPVLEHRRLP